MTHLKAGDPAPDFSSVTQDGERLTLADLKGQRTILYFYPKDNTSGCTLEAKSLRDGREELAQRGFRIIGVSPDSEQSHRNFCAKHELNFTLLADTDHSVPTAYGPRSRCTAANTWACCARPSSSTPRDASNGSSRRWTPGTTTGRSSMPAMRRHEMKRFARIATLAVLLLAAATVRGQEPPGCMTPGARSSMRQLVEGVPFEARIRADLRWIRDDADPIRRERRIVERMMRERARERAREASEGAARGAAPSDPSVEMGEWRLSVGNNGNWSPYPDRALDARIIRFPMRDIRELDRAKKSTPPRPVPPK